MFDLYLLRNGITVSKHEILKFVNSIFKSLFIKIKSLSFPPVANKAASHKKPYQV